MKKFSVIFLFLSLFFSNQSFALIEVSGSTPTLEERIKILKNDNKKLKAKNEILLKKLVKQKQDQNKTMDGKLIIILSLVSTLIIIIIFFIINHTHNRKNKKPRDKWTPPKKL